MTSPPTTLGRLEPAPLATSGCVKPHRVFEECIMRVCNTACQTQGTLVCVGGPPVALGLNAVTESSHEEATMSRSPVLVVLVCGVACVHAHLHCDSPCDLTLPFP
eukprot:1810256-Alexandrium_andersonii.AAC.1